MNCTHKSLVLIILIICILFQSCKKDKNDDEVAPTPATLTYKMSCKINGKQWQTNDVDGTLQIDTANGYRSFLFDANSILQNDTGVWFVLTDTNISTSYVGTGLYQFPGGVFPYFPLIDMFLVVGNVTLFDFDQIESKISIDSIDNVNHILKYATFSSTLFYSASADTFKITNGVVRNSNYVIQ